MTWRELDPILRGGPRRAQGASASGGRLRQWLTTEEEAALRAAWGVYRRQGGKGEVGAPPVPSSLLLPPPGEGLREDLGRLLRDGAF